MQGTFKSETQFEKRLELCTRLRKQHPDRIPIIVEVAKNSQLTIKCRKFLAPSEISIGGFLNVIRKQASIGYEEACFIFCGTAGTLVPTSNTMAQVYEKYKDEDGFLYIIVALENTFGVLNTLDSWTFDLLNGILASSGRVVRGLVL
uniref:Ubiquitin-like protein n=1 Tax=Marseillevirus LCMAC201 TaxID=2506605 RepID=A0A481YW55_9VIRU|nr:MAG: ubiquitin-like protein [Marseillevirus LCMAC201]